MTITLHPVRIGPANGAARPAETPTAAKPAAETVTPLIDIHETPDGLVLEADLPGASEKTLAVELEDNVLTITANVEQAAVAQARLLHEEFRPSVFHRSFILSDEVDRNRITAELKAGVLRLVLPKAERACTRRIEVRSG
jgi:HSP20 family molecular chaperone IbpA